MDCYLAAVVGAAGQTIPRHDIRCRLPLAGDRIARGANAKTTLSLLRFTNLFGSNDLGASIIKEGARSTTIGKSDFKIISPADLEDIRAKRAQSGGEF
jgi:hypothetical protein